MSPTNLTRRSFMKASALAAGAAALGSGVATVNNLVESDQAYAADEVKLVHTSCRACISNCGIIAHVQNGRVIKLEGDPAECAPRASRAFRRCITPTATSTP